MDFATFARRSALVVGASAVLVLSGSLAWAAANDYDQRQVIPVGVTVNGTDIGGMTPGQAREVFRREVADPVQRPITVTADGKTFTFDPAGAVTVDTEAMVQEALAPRRTAPFVTRVRNDLGQIMLRAEVTPRYTVDQAKVKAFVADVKKAVERKPVDAKIDVVDGKLVVQRSATGRKLDVAAAEQVITDQFSAERALAPESRMASVTVAKTKPKVAEKDLGKTIIVSRSKKTLDLYDGAKLEKGYRCAVGTPQYPTPLGKWQIVSKQHMPTWYNPGSAWAKSMPKTIPPGPSNPLGTRALALDASGVLIHGTSKDYSIGTAASHGCMRMHMWDVEDLFPRVEVGTPVYVIP